MDWANLGSITPVPEWELFNTPVIGTELFRVRNYWTVKPYYRLYAYLGQFFATSNEVLVSRRIYPFKDTAQDIELLIPQDLKNSGIITRYIGIKLALPRKAGTYNHDWRVELDEYMGVT